MNWRPSKLYQINLGFKNIESITTEVRTETDRLCFAGVYKPPSMKHDVFITDFSNARENVLSRYDNLFTLGDLNYDMLDKDKSSGSYKSQNRSHLRCR